MKTLQSIISEFQGECSPTWLNRNRFLNRLDGGATGFFKLTKKVFFGILTVKTGVEFHGIIKNGQVESTINDIKLMNVSDMDKTIVHSIHCLHGGKMHLTQQQIDNIEMHMHDVCKDCEKIKSMYVDEVRYDEEKNLYYIAMRHESRKGIAEYCVELDFAATNAPYVIIKDQPFHMNDFPVLLFKYVA